jgi:hypothetical protein
LETDIKTPSFLDEILENLDTCGRLPDRIIIAVVFRSPNKVQRRTKSLVSPSKSGIDDELSVTTDRDESAVG